MSIHSSTRLPIYGRKPLTKEEGRVCSTKDCDKILTRYNTAETCFYHQPKKYARVRGINFKP